MPSPRLDLALAVRQLAKSPGFTVAAVLTLALGIGATSAAFSLFDALFWRPLPGIAEPDRAVVVYGQEGDGGPGVGSYVDFRDFQAFEQRDPVFAGLAAFKSLKTAVGAGDVDLRGRAVMVTEGFFSTLGSRPALGRLDVAEGSAVISHELWQRAFAGSPDAVGREVRVRGIPLTVAGVAPAGFRVVPLETTGDVYVSMSLQPRLMDQDLLAKRGWGGVYLVGRLAPGVASAAAQVRVDAYSERLAREYPSSNGERSYHLEPFDRARISPHARGTVAGVSAILAGAVLAVLLIACANVAGLQGVRAMRRAGEVAVRSALGAPRSALVRQVLGESLVLALLGGLAGLALAAAILAAVSQLPMPFRLDLGIDPRVLAFTAVVAAACALLSGLAPALQAGRRDLSPLMHRADRRAGTRLRGALVVTQVGLSLALLLVATLLLRTVMELREVPIGFDTRGLFVAEVGAGTEGGPAVYARLLEEVRRIPGVDGASVVGLLPGEDAMDRLGMRPEGAGPETRPLMAVLVGDGYFETLGVSMAEGRDLSSGDDAQAPVAMVVNRSFADRFWPGGSAVGRRIALVGTGIEATVVGVVANTRVGALRSDVEPIAFGSFRQVPGAPPNLHLVVRSRLPAQLLAPEVRAAATEAGGWSADFGSMDERLGGSVFLERTVATTLGLFGLTALALAAVGLYGLLAVAVGERRHEIGVRMALGADGARVRRLVVGRGLVLVVTGAALGLLVGVSAAGALEGLLYGVGRLDPVSLVGSTLVLLLVAVSASWIPAARAAALDPNAVLRQE